MSTDKKSDLKPRRLGRGLNSLLGSPVAVDISDSSPVKPATGDLVNGDHTPEAVTRSLSDVQSVRVDSVEPSPFQPRRVFDEAQLAGLAQSIRQSGVLQPILVRALPQRDGGGVRYELIAGERRWRAAKLAGLNSIPALVKQMNDEHAAELALVENVQREDLNAMERAWALRSLVDRFGLTQATLAERVGLERSSVANLLRLTELEGEITELIAGGKLGAGHGKALLAFGAGESRVKLARKAAAEELSVRALERLTSGTAQAETARHDKPGVNIGDDPRLAVLSDLQRQIGQQLGTKVAIHADRKGKKGRIILEFYGLDHFDSLMNRLNVKTH
ncbi:MAG: ParB/RepB/Spo0J family partition protein [Phycisphaerales bacterium]|jgi:ParB family chromosome partitioning protein